MQQKDSPQVSPAARQIALRRRGVLAGGAAALAQIASPYGAARAATVVPEGKLTLAWHTNIAPRWLDPQQHDGTASPDNFLMALHDGLIKNFRDELYDHAALAERFEFAEDAKSATFWLRPGTKFHDGSPVTPADVKWSYEHYHGAWGEVLREQTKAWRWWTTRRSGSNSSSHSSISRFCWARQMSAAPAGSCLRSTTNRSARTGSAEADRRGPLQAGVAGTRRAARIRGIRRLLPPGPHQAVDDGQRSRGGNAGGNARARRSRYHLLRPRRTDRPGEEQSKAATGAGGLGQLVAGVPGFQNP